MARDRDPGLRKHLCYCACSDQHQLQTSQGRKDHGWGRLSLEESHHQQPKNKLRVLESPLPAAPGAEWGHRSHRTLCQYPHRVTKSGCSGEPQRWTAQPRFQNHHLPTNAPPAMQPCSLPCAGNLFQVENVTGWGSRSCFLNTQSLQNQTTQVPGGDPNLPVHGPWTPVTIPDTSLQRIGVVWVGRDL